MLASGSRAHLDWVRQVPEHIEDALARHPLHRDECCLPSRGATSDMVDPRHWNGGVLLQPLHYPDLAIEPLLRAFFISRWLGWAIAAQHADDPPRAAFKLYVQNLVI